MQLESKWKLIGEPLEAIGKNAIGRDCNAIGKRFASNWESNSKAISMELKINLNAIE